MGFTEIRKQNDLDGSLPVPRYIDCVTGSFNVLFTFLKNKYGISIEIRVIALLPTAF